MGHPTVRIAAADQKEFSTALEGSHVGKACAGRLFSVTAYNKSADPCYLLIFDLAAVPANGTKPTLAPVAVPVGTTASYPCPETTPMGTGIVAALSSTDSTLTVLGAVGWFHFNFS